MSDELMPMLDPDRYTDEEWAIAEAGICGWQVGNHPHDICGQPASPASPYRFCGDHDRQAADANPRGYARDLAEVTS